MRHLSSALGRALASLRPTATAAGRNALIIPPALPGSLGDAAMISAASARLRELGAAAVDLLYGKDWPLDEKIDRRLSGERFFYRQSAIEHALLLSALPRYAELYLIGADVIDGAYNPRSVNARLSLLAEAARLGNKAALLGASYNKNPEETTRKALRALPESVAICARDPVSRARLEGALDRPIRQVADLAFLLRPSTGHPLAGEALAWIEARRQAGDQVIGLNANYLHAERDPGIPKALGSFVERLLERPLSILLMPHDTRSTRPDQQLLAEATAAVSPKDGVRVHMLSPVSPGVVRAVMPALDMLATGRMHIAILGLSAGVPAFCFAYQDKFEGLLQLFELEQAALLSTPQELSRSPRKTADKFVDRLQDRDALAGRIDLRLPPVMALARQNFS